jgi:alanine-synthesizing transaminase
MKEIKQSQKLKDVCYDIRGPVLKTAQKLEEEGYHIYKLNIGNPAPFGLYAPDEIIHDVILNINEAQGYSDSQGILSARIAIMQHCQSQNIKDVDVEDIYLGNGVSELIVMCMQGLLNVGDEMLIPSPDYPLWTAAVNLAGGRAVHYVCDEQAEWNPDILEQVIKLAVEHSLVLFADEIYENILYDDNKFTPLASMNEDTLCITLSGLSKAHRLAGFRSGWMVISGKKSMARNYIEGLGVLSSMRLCSNVVAQLAVQTALGGFQSIKELTAPGGRLYEQRNVCHELLTAIPGVTCVKPKAALYLFPKLDIKKFNMRDDMKFILDLLVQEKVLLVQGTGFNWPHPDHFRIVFLPPVADLRIAISRIGHFLSHYSQR